MADRLHLRIALGKHPHVAPLRDGRATSSRLQLEFVEFDPLPHAFRQMVRSADLDVSEMAVITHLLAHRFAKPIVGLAIPLWSRLPHTNLICRADSAMSGPSDLSGTRIGVRSYAQTSGVWVRGILAEDYGVDLESILWGTMEDAHLAEYVDPPNTRRYPPQPPLRDLLLQGEFTAIMGERVVDPNDVRPVIPSPDAAAHDWIARTGIKPINHTLAIRSELVEAHPWLPGELLTLFRDAAKIADEADAFTPSSYGIETCHDSLDRALRYAFEQAITPRRYAVEELYLPL